MAVTRFGNAAIAFGQHNLSGQSTKVDIGMSVDMLDATVFSESPTKVNVAGLSTWDIGFDGFWDTAALATAQDISDPLLFNAIDLAQASVLTIGADNTGGSRAWLGEVQGASLKFFGKVGDINPFAFTCKPGSKVGTWGYVSAPFTARSAAGNGTGIRFRDTGIGVLATEMLVGHLHVVAFDGTTMTAILESDDNAGFTSATTRLTMTAATGKTVERKTLAGEITDEYFRFRWTFTGTSFTALMALGYGPTK